MNTYEFSPYKEKDVKAIKKSLIENNFLQYITIWFTKYTHIHQSHQRVVTK